MSKKASRKQSTNWQLQRLATSKTKLIVVFFGGLLLLALLLVAGFALFQLWLNTLLENSVDSEIWHTFQLESYPLSIDYPDLWVAHETQQGNHGDYAVIGVIAFPSGFNFAPFIEIAKKSEFRFNGDTLNEFLSSIADWAESRIPRLGYKELSLKSIETDGQAALIREYSYVSQNIFGYYRIYCQDFYLWSEGVGYAFTFCAEKDEFQHFKPMFHRMQGSIRFDTQLLEPTSIP